MKRLFIITAVGAASVMGLTQAHAGINGENANGYFDRGVAMYLDKNYDGCLDQMLQIRNLNPELASSEDVHYYIAMATLYTGDDEAIDLLESFLLRFPESYRTQEVTATVGDYYFTRGSYGEALETYRKVNPEALSADRADDLIYRMAYSHMMLGENDRALSLFKQLAGNKRYGNAAKFYEAYMAYARRDYSLARKLFAEVDTSRQPGQSARYYLCQIDFFDGEYRKAYSEADALLKSGDTKDFSTELERIAGESLYNMGRTSQAVPYLRRYVEQAESPLPSAYYILGVSDYESGRYDEAVKELQKAVGTENITGQSAYLYLGQAYAETGDVNAAMLAFDKASRMSFDRKVAEAAAYNYIAARMDGGRVPFANSVGLMEEFLKNYPSSDFANSVRESLVSGYMSESDYDRALRILNSASSPTPKMLAARQRVLLMLGDRAYRNGETEKALEYFKEGITAKGGTADVTAQCRLWAANCYYDLDDYDKAADGYLSYLNSAPKTDTNRLSAYYNLGYTRLRQEMYDDAYTDFLKVAENPSADAAVRADAYNRAADCRYCEHRFDEASTYYNKAYQTYPQAGDYALFQQAQMKGFDRDYNGRINLIDDMLSKFPSSALAPDAMMAKAESYTVLGKSSQANGVYAEIIDRYPSTAQARRAALLLAMNRLNGGDRNGAIETYKEVAASYPSSDEARVALEDLKNIYAADGNLPQFIAFVNAIPDMPKVEMSELESTAFATAEEQYLATQRTDRMVDYLTQFADGANVPAALLYMARVAAGRGDSETAEGYALRLVSTYPDSPQSEEAMLLKAEAEANQGKGEIALDSYKQLAKRASTPDLLADARMGILTTAVGLNRFNDALEAADNILSSSAANVDIDNVKFYRATALHRLGRKDEAYTAWEELAKEPATIAGSKSAVSLIESLTADGQFDRADRAANRFIDAGSPHDYWYARGFIAYSDLLRRQGKTFEADEYLKALKENYPGADADIFEMIESRLDK